MIYIPSPEELEAVLPYLSPEERDELDFLISAPRKDAPIPQDFGRWLVEASPTFSWHWKHLVIVRSYLASMDRGEFDRLSISLPPRHGKSEQLTIRRPAFKMEHDPSRRTIIGAYGVSLAKQFSRKTRSIVRERERILLNHERQAADEWETTEGGGILAAGVGTGVTGKGADECIIDDPVKSRAEANSQAYRDACYDWYVDDLMTRLEPNGTAILQMTRWHEDDLAGRILSSEEGKYWTVLNLPALAEKDDPLGRSIGEALCPERFNEEQLLRIKERMKSSFHALYQGRPVAAEGNIILTEWFRYYDAMEPEYSMMVQSWDTGSKEKELNDPSVCTTWGITRANYDLLDEYRKRVTYPDLKKAAIQQAERWGPDAVLIEDKGNGTALLQDLRANTRIPVVAIEPHGDKVTRLSNESPAYESGTVRHPRYSKKTPWIVDFEAELISIPNATHDDRGDSVSQFLKWAKRHAGRLVWESTGDGRSEDGNLNLDSSKGYGTVSSGGAMSGF